MVGGNGGNQFRQYAGQNARNLNGYNANVENQFAQNPRVQNNEIQNQIGNGNLVVVRAEGNAAGHNRNQIRCYNCRGVGYFARDCIVKPRRKDAAYLQTQLLIAQKEEAGIQLQAKEYDLMAAAADLDEIEEVNANCILIANLQQASSSGTQTDCAPVYDSDGSAEELDKLEADYPGVEESGRSNLICNHLRTETGVSLTVIGCCGVRHILLDVVLVNVSAGRGTVLVRMITTAATSAETAGVEEFELNLATTALARV
nr:Gag-Pol polyprotein [Tanacetum cinerariifolium]